MILKKAETNIESIVLNLKTLVNSKYAPKKLMLININLCTNIPIQIGKIEKIIFSSSKKAPKYPAKE